MLPRPSHLFLIRAACAVLVAGFVLPGRLAPAALAEGGPTLRDFDPWRLRPSEDRAVPRDAKGRALSEIPEARRLIRIVYPGLIEPR